MMIQLLTIIIPFTIFFFFIIRQRRGKKNPPGPKGLPLIGNLHDFNRPSLHIYLWKLSKKYGPLMHMKLGSIPVIIVTSSKIAEQVLKTQDLAFSSRPKFLGQHRVFYDGLDIAFSPYSDTWRELRKIGVIHLFSNKRVHSFKPVREELVFEMMGKISDEAGSGSDRDWNLSTNMLAFASTLICKIAFGKVFQGQGSEQHMRLDKLMIEAQAMQGGYFVSDYLPSFGWVDRLSGMIGRLDKVCHELDVFFQELIDDHLNPSRPKSTTEFDILDCMIRLKEENMCSIDLTWNHIKAILSDVFIAGTDTAAATITWAMTALIKNPKIMKRLQSEIRDIVGSKGRVVEDDLSKLVYLKAVVKETLRLYPPAPLLLPRETLEKCTLQGYTIQPKTVVYINAWAIAREEYYWENPNEFKPERFMNGGNNIDITGRDSFHVLPFGGGRRGCPGLAMGMVNVELALANLLYSFDWELPRGMKAEDIDTEVLPGLTMHKKNHLCLVPRIYKHK